MRRVVAYSRVEEEDLPVVTAVELQEIPLSREALLVSSHRQATLPLVHSTCMNDVVQLSTYSSSHYIATCYLANCYLATCYIGGLKGRPREGKRREGRGFAT